jgi:hypothetical protein
MEVEVVPEIDPEEEVEGVGEEDDVLVEEERDALVVVIEALVPEEAFLEAFLEAVPEVSPTDEEAVAVRNAAKHWRQTWIVFEVEA